MGKIIFGSQSLLNSAPLIPVLFGWTVENTYRLFKIHHVVFRGLSGAVLRFSWVSFWFWRNKSFFRNMQCCSKLGPKIMDFWEYLAKNHEVVRTDQLDEQTKKYESGETDKCVKNRSENCGEHSEEYRWLWSSRRVNREIKDQLLWEFSSSPPELRFWLIIRDLLDGTTKITYNIYSSRSIT